MKYLRIIFFSIGLLFSSHTYCQDQHFSQFNSAPQTLNPALTGSINGQSRVIANHRNQWNQILKSDAYNNFSLSYDYRANLNSGDYVGLGASYSGNVSGAARFGTNQLNISFSYAKILSKSGSSSNVLIGGVQAGLAQRKIDMSNLRWSTQVDINGPIGTVDKPDFLFTDLNGGLVWVSRFGERKSFYIGIAGFHMNSPNVSFQNNSVQRMSLKMCVHAGSELPLSDKLSLLPSLMFLRQGVHAQINMGTMLSITKTSDSIIPNFQGGIFYRAGQDFTGQIHSDAIIAMLSFQMIGIQLGFSYDVTISNLPIRRLGAAEISIGYIFKKSEKNASTYGLPQL